MSVLGHTVVSSRLGERLYVRPVFNWCNPVRRQAAASSCGVVLCSPQVLAGALRRAEDCGFWAVSVAQPVSGMATGSGRPDADRQSRDAPILLCTQRVGVTLRSPELYDLDPDCVTDVLGLHARRPEAPLTKVMLGRYSQCVPVLIPDDDVGHRGFHDVVLVDRTEEDVPYVAVSDLSALRQQWPDLVISGMTNRQLELDELRRMCKKKYCGAPTGLCTFCGKVIMLDMF